MTIISSPSSEEILANEAEWLQHFDEHMEYSLTSKVTYFIAVVTSLLALAAFARRVYRFLQKGLYRTTRADKLVNWCQTTTSIRLPLVKMIRA
jgi:oligoendopeptidase F